MIILPFVFIGGTFGSLMLLNKQINKKEAEENRADLRDLPYHH
ncbi:hypothetical protein ACFPU1_08710 [Thalassorhabdus alkalitolerans]|uniref:Uncharacterized protein n=1 Tax=Thalassorhabdus alkalitolerans TaxID=2282697 RepID=A0ABW0YK92_9BACI|nr:hypothetical protein [Thalassobacillus sp. C254]